MMYPDAVSVNLKNLILKVCESPAFDDFRLGGGTALALQRGHRVSEDADFISSSLDKQVVTANAMKLFPQAQDLHQGEFGVFMRVHGVKVDFLSWNKPFIRPAVIIDGIRLLHQEEIAAMKLFAILQRGEKKDYFDIAELLGSYSLKQLVSFYNERHPDSDPGVIVRFLSSYSDIKNQPDPIMLNGANWNNCTATLASAIKTFVTK